MTVDGFNRLLFSVIQDPAIEKAISEDADVAGIPKYMFAKIEIRGNN